MSPELIELAHHIGRVCEMIAACDAYEDVAVDCSVSGKMKDAFDAYVKSLTNVDVERVDNPHAKASAAALAYARHAYSTPRPQVPPPPPSPVPDVG